jgi:hypothetical protein
VLAIDYRKIGGSPSPPEGKLKSARRALFSMKQIHIWPNHVRVAHLNLVLYRPSGEPLTQSLQSLARLGFDTRPENVEVHEGVPEH